MCIKKLLRWGRISLRPVIFSAVILVFLSLFSCQKYLTEEEQRDFEGCIDARFIAREDAIKYLRTLVKGDAETIRWYKESEKSNNPKIQMLKMMKMDTDIRSLYQNDICAAIKVISRNKNIKWVVLGEKYIMESLPQGKHVLRSLSKDEIKEVEEGYNLILQVIKQKAEFPRARACAVRAITFYGGFKDGKWYGEKRSIPVLKQAINDKAPEVRLLCAKALLNLGEGDAALPVIEELAKAGTEQSIAALRALFVFKELEEFNGKKMIVLSDTELWDERGKEILIKALNYSSDEVRAFAALRLVRMKTEEKLAEDTAIRVLERLKGKKSKDYTSVSQQESDGNAGINAVAVLEMVGSVSGRGVLKALVINNDNPFLRERAKSALKHIGGS